VSRLPVIVSVGGINPAGRLSAHHAYRRLVIDALSASAADDTYRSLAALMNLNDDPALEATRSYIRDHTLVRRIECFDPEAIGWQRHIRLAPTGDALTFKLGKRQLPDRVPPDWDVKEDGGALIVTVKGGMDALIADSRVSKVTSAGQLPTGFDPEKLYQARSHPRGLQLTIFGASDAVQALGIDWNVLRAKVKPDQFATYSGSAMGQLDFDGTGGMMQSALMGKRVTSKQVALGLCEMPADFINAYVLGSIGATGATIGACATFLYNLRQGIEDITSGRRRVVVVGNSEAPITPEVIEGYRTMGALAEDDALMALDNRTDGVDNRRAVRPFSSNCGFTLAEAAVYVVLFDDELAVELGASVYGAVGDVYVNADGFKKSIPGPGVGNYVTMAKAMALARTILGDEALRTRTYIQAHGTSTPQNRVTESHIMNELAKTFGIEKWTVGAVKAFVGHSLAPASGDQLAAILGTWQYGWIPGITTIDHVAKDVHASHLCIENRHIEVGAEGMDGAFINSKGFGGNNATALILAPHVVRRMLERKHGRAAMAAHATRNEAVVAASAEYDAKMTRGEGRPIYQFGEGVLEGSDLDITTSRIKVPGWGQPIDLELSNPYPDMS
jgi:acetoacetyl-[acyl-carrier protein] synthase